MSCLGWLKRKKGSRSGRRGSSASAPATTMTTMTTTTTTTGSAVSTSRSDDSGAGRQTTSKSTGSASSQPSISSLYEERGHGQLRTRDEVNGHTGERQH